eukprot:TRINITY_DN1912_c1_g1_i1.p1 TRINITY_DN1912_c1_g1~~TRINITY_DN1912_c1_g1_i1.p1  ORF type:complete len:701 (+),score=182.49 TRINITY_DN1912_c1_g1_i1:63-2165(+)
MASSPTREDTDLIEYFINLFPGMDPGFVSDVATSEDVSGDKEKIHELLVSMGGVPTEQNFVDVDDVEEDLIEDMEEVQDFIMESNEHVANLMANLEATNTTDIEQVREDIKKGEIMLKKEGIHPISKESLDFMIREANEVLSCVPRPEEQMEQSIHVDIPVERTGADPAEVTRLREQLKKEQREKQELQRQLDAAMNERDSLVSATQGLDKPRATSASSIALKDANKKLRADEEQATKNLESAKAYANSLKEENDNLRDALITFITHAKRTISRVRENSAAAKAGLEEEMTRSKADFETCFTTIGKLKQTEMMEKLYKKMERMYREEVALRKQYYNTIQELRGNIRVFARVRPLIGLELAKGNTETCTNYPKDEPEMLTVTDTRSTKKYTFNKVYGPTSTQEDIFVDTLPLIDSVVDGYNVCVFAYGQTGSGKSFTMEGPSLEEVSNEAEFLKLRGVNRRAIDRLYSIIQERSDAEEVTVYLSVLEIYCEKIRDLLQTNKKLLENADPKIRVGLHPVGEFEVPGNYVEGLVQKQVNSANEIVTLLDQAKASRKEGKTDMNAHSSRSHMILTLVVCCKNVATGAQSFGKLNLIDLAGSERLAKTNATGQQAVEAKNINNSLSCLGKVIYDLQAGSSFVNYRDSKLTHLLQDSLGGSSKVLMFANCSPAASNSGETKNTLEMASRAMKCSLGQASKNKVKSK